MKTRNKLVETRTQLSARVARWQLTLDSFPILFERLEGLGLEPYFDAKEGCINISVTGDAGRLGEIWRELRTAGFQADRRPKPGETTFHSYWRHARDGDEKNYAQFWLYFTSNVCRRVQVGTRMEEVPIYEMHCGEHEQTVLGELLPSENDNPQAREG